MYVDKHILGWKIKKSSIFAKSIGDISCIIKIKSSHIPNFENKI